MTQTEGQVIRFTGTFTTEATGVAVDPTTVIFAFRYGQGTTTTYKFGVGGQIVQDSSGVYHVDIDTTGSTGILTGEWASSGVGQAIGSTGVQINPWPIVPSFS